MTALSEEIAQSTVYHHLMTAQMIQTMAFTQIMAVWTPGRSGEDHLKNSWWWHDSSLLHFTSLTYQECYPYVPPCFTYQFYAKSWKLDIVYSSDLNIKEGWIYFYNVLSILVFTINLFTAEPFMGSWLYKHNMLQPRG